MIININFYDDLNMKRLDTDEDIVDKLVKIDLQNDIIICTKTQNYINMDEYYNLNIKAVSSYEINHNIFKLPIKILTPLNIDLSFKSLINGKIVIDWNSDLLYGYICDDKQIADNLIVSNIKNLKYKFYNQFILYTQNIHQPSIIKQFNHMTQIPTNTNIFKINLYNIFNGVNEYIHPNIFLINSKYIFERLPNF